MRDVLSWLDLVSQNQSKIPFDASKKAHRAIRSGVTLYPMIRYTVEYHCGDRTVDLFDDLREQNRLLARPLAARMRPRTLDEFVGQEHFLGAGQAAPADAARRSAHSLIFYGPPGTRQDRTRPRHRQPHQEPVQAAERGRGRASRTCATPRRSRGSISKTLGERTILFLDEIHRFNRAQQDVLLPDVEDGVVILIGATTQNPFFAINTPLLSRSQIFTFEPLTREHIRTLITRALADTERGLGNITVTLTDDALAFLVRSRATATPAVR